MLLNRQSIASSITIALCAYSLFYSKASDAKNYVSTLNPDALEQLVERANKEVEHLGQSRNCVTCMPAESNDTAYAQSKICTDLYSAACLDTGGRRSYSNPDQLTDRLNQTIQIARDKAARLMHFKSFNDALKNELEHSGIKILPKVAPSVWSSLETEHGVSDSSAIFADVANCYNSTDAFSRADQIKTVSNNIPLPVTLKRKDLKIKNFIKEYQQKVIRLSAEDLPDFFDDVAKSCSKITNNNNYNDGGFNGYSFNSAMTEPNIPAVCRRLSKMQQEGVEIYRLKGTKAYRKLAEMYVQANSLPDYAYGPAHPATDPVARLITEIQQLTYKSAAVCLKLSQTTKSAAAQITKTYMSKIDLTKPVVDTLIDSYFGDKNKTNANIIFNIVRRDEKKIVRQLVSDPTKRKAILAGYSNLHMQWIDKPQKSAYVQGISGLPTLKLDKIVSFDTNLKSVFSDPSLSFFKTINAEYLPKISVATKNFPEQIQVMPGLLNDATNNPLGFLAIIAHEEGHKIGPNISKLNGYDLSARYNNLMSCFKDAHSIDMNDSQKDEVFADYMSSEVLAMELQKIEPNRRKKTLLALMAPFCRLDDEKTIDFTDEHPPVPLRISGIFGANPFLRKIIGCSGDSPKFKSCGINLKLQSEDGN